MTRSTLRVASTLSILALVGAAGTLGGCQSTKAADHHAGDHADHHAAAGVVNSKCPMMPDHPLEAGVTAMHKGQLVGFCCAGCIPEWESLSDAQKDARLAKSR